MQFGEWCAICLAEFILMDFQKGGISEQANDGKRFLLEHFDTIQKSPSHIYHSALPLSPSSSWVYKQYIAEALPVVKVVKGVPAGWGVCSRTILLDSPTWTLSHHNNSIAVGSNHGDIIILSAITGSQSAVLSGHKSLVACVVFSSEGSSLVSGSYDKTVKLWDIQTGGVVKTFLGHTDKVWSASISADLTIIASGSFDQTIRLWNIQTGECYQTIQERKCIDIVKFSPKDPHHFISMSDSKVYQWDANCSQIRPPFDGTSVAFSSDGAQFVSCFGKTITVHGYSSGVIGAEFQVVDNAHRCCFSPDNRLIAIAGNNTAYCWDITTSKPQLVETFIGHAGHITSLTFSSSTTLVSASQDNSVKFWQIGAQSADLLAIDLKPTSPPSAPVESIILQSKQDIAFIVHFDGVVEVWDTLTGICRRSSQTQVSGACIKDAQLVKGRLILVYILFQGMIHVYDGEDKGIAWKTPDIYDIKISGDGSRVFALSEGYVLVWSLQTGEFVGEVKSKYHEHQSLIVDGSKVWVFTPPSKYKGWDFGILGSKPMKLFNKSKAPSVRNFWVTNEARIRSPATVETVFQLSGRFLNSVCVQCDNSYLVASYQSGEILILDLRNVK